MRTVVWFCSSLQFSLYHSDRNRCSVSGCASNICAGSCFHLGNDFCVIVQELWPFVKIFARFASQNKMGWDDSLSWYPEMPWNLMNLSRGVYAKQITSWELESLEIWIRPMYFPLAVWILLYSILWLPPGLAHLDFQHVLLLPLSPSFPSFHVVQVFPDALPGQPPRLPPALLDLVAPQGPPGPGDPPCRRGRTCQPLSRPDVLQDLPTRLRFAAPPLPAHCSWEKSWV